jgi:hypothetical protein
MLMIILSLQIARKLCVQEPPGNGWVYLEGELKAEFNLEVDWETG